MALRLVGKAVVATAQLVAAECELLTDYKHVRKCEILDHAICMPPGLSIQSASMIIGYWATSLHPDDHFHESSTVTISKS